MIKKSYFILFFSLVISMPTCISDSTSIKVSPLKTELSLKINGETNCTIFYVLPDSKMSITSRWSKNYPGEADKYNLSKEQIKLKINYTRIEYGKYEVCFEPAKAGLFYGIIFFQQENSLVKMGSWINLNVTQTTPIEIISLITGNTISKINGTNIGLGLTLFLLLVVLGLIVKRAFIDKYP